MTAGRVFPDKRVLDGDADLSSQRDLEFRLFTVPGIDTPRGRDELNEERDFVRNAEGEGRRNK